MFEAFRRNQMADSHEQTKPLHLRWLGLGTLSVYRTAFDAGLMEWAASVPAPRCMGWVKLTTKGTEVLKEHEAEFKEIFDRMMNIGYGKTILANYTLAGGLVCGRGDRGF